LVGAHELPAIGRNTMDVEAARRAMIGDIEQRTDTVRHEDLQIGYCERRVAGDPHIGQAGKMRDPLLDRPVVLGVRGPAGDRSPSGRPGEFGATVEHAVLSPHRSRVISSTGIRAGRMAGDEAVDLVAVLDQAKPLFWCPAVFCVDCHLLPPYCRAKSALPAPATSAARRTAPRRKSPPKYPRNRAPHVRRKTANPLGLLQSLRPRPGTNRRQR